MSFQKGERNVIGNIFFMFRLLKLSPGIIIVLYIKTILCIRFAKFYLFSSVYMYKNSLVFSKRSFWLWQVLSGTFIVVIQRGSCRSKS